MADFTKIDLWLGTFEGKSNKFVWKKLESFDSFDKAYAAFRKFIKEQLEYDSEELMKIWNSPRLDIELKQGDKLINWHGIYYNRRAKKIVEEQEEEQDETTEDTMSFSESDCNFGLDHMFKPR